MNMAGAGDNEEVQRALKEMEEEACPGEGGQGQGDRGTEETHGGRERADDAGVEKETGRDAE
jgi:hypothetical protein